VGGSPGEVQAVPWRVRWWVRTVTVLVVASVIVPLTWPPGRDSFPLTPYPMFSTIRDDTRVVLVVAAAEGSTGTVVLPTEATGHRQLTQAARTLADAVRAGGDRPHRLCTEVADWILRTDREDVYEVRILTVAHDGIDYFLHDQRVPEVLAEHAACEVIR
jgi:hypothetical protein